MSDTNTVYMLEERINLAARMLGKARTPQTIEYYKQKIASLEAELAQLTQLKSRRKE